ncbi:ABC transporter substrate-binding protein [Egicoccus sp. AB-alg6-2]|uniref:ABC transporter substrate-binding protein n=1 Tax=Egicoccus sp. AB-alg6-2 TaxID=3242692 RepID=UPI00359D65D0
MNHHDIRTARRGRRRRRLAAALATALLLAACGGGSTADLDPDDLAGDTEPDTTDTDTDTDTDGDTAEGADDGGDLDLTLLSTQLRPVEEAEAVRNVVLADFPGNVEFIGEDDGPFVDRILAEAQAGSGSVDVIGALHGDFGTFAAEDVLMDLSDLLEELSADREFPESLIDLTRFGGDAVYYIPWVQATYAMVASNEAVEYLPDGADLNALTYDELLEWARILEEETGAPQFGLPAGEDGLLHRFFQGFLYPAFTGGVNTTFTSDSAVEGWSWLQEIWEHANPQSTTYGFMQEPLLSGEVMVAWDHTARLVGALEERPDDFVAFPSPTGPEGLAFMPVVGGLGIPANAPDPEGAKALIEYLTRPEVAALTLRETAFFPGTGDELPDDLEGGVAALAEVVAAQQQSPDALPSLLPIGLGDQGGAYNKVFQDSFRAIVLQGNDPAGVLSAEADNLQRVLDTAGASCWFPDPDSEGPCQVQ